MSMDSHPTIAECIFQILHKDLRDILHPGDRGKTFFANFNGLYNALNAEVFRAIYKLPQVVGMRCPQNILVGLELSISPTEMARQRREIGEKYLRELRVRWSDDWDLGFMSGGASHLSSPAHVTAHEHFLTLCRIYDRWQRTGEDKYITIKKENLTSLGKDAVSHIKYLLRQGALAFPWKRLEMQDPSHYMTNLRAHKPLYDNEFPSVPQGTVIHSDLLAINYMGNVKNLVQTEKDYSDIDVLVDYFQEKARLAARRKDQVRAVGHPLCFQLLYLSSCQIQIFPTWYNSLLGGKKCRYKLSNYDLG